MVLNFFSKWLKCCSLREVSSNVANAPIKVHTKLLEIHSHKTQVAKKDTSVLQLCKSYIYLSIWGSTSLSTLYRSYHDG